MVYHLHGVCEDDAVKTDEVLMVERVHGVDLTDEIVQSVWLCQDVCLQTLHRYVQLETNERAGLGTEKQILMFEQMYVYGNHFIF